LKYGFSAFGMGYIGMQPDDDDDSIAAMDREIAGGPFEFLAGKDLSTAPRLRPVCMGSRCNRGYEKKLHFSILAKHLLSIGLLINVVFSVGVKSSLPSAIANLSSSS
jgi:hypothetical protein